MNILMFLKPKSEVSFVYDHFTIRQILEKMEQCRFTSIPVLNIDGQYVGTITEGDVLWAIKKTDDFSIKKAEELKLTDCTRVRDYTPININKTMEDLIKIAVDQNFVPVIDDRNMFIGIVTRKDILQYYFAKAKISI